MYKIVPSVPLVHADMVHPPPPVKGKQLEGMKGSTLMYTNTTTDTFAAGFNEKIGNSGNDEIASSLQL